MVERFGMAFEKGAGLDQGERTLLLGGKSAGLARMVELGLPVPPGFTLTTLACRTYLDSAWGPELESTLTGCLAELEDVTGKRLGDRRRPLLVSVRSGAPVSMPGMMDTVLNVGITEEIARALGEATSDPRFGWDTMRRFAQSYASYVRGAPAELVRSLSEEYLGDDEGAAMGPVELERATLALKAAFAGQGYPVAADPREQLREAIGAVFSSWTCDRARTYRRIEGIADDLFTAATVQMMAFGNLGGISGTGVAFSRNPSSGEPGLVGDFLRGAQGEDVVAGTHRTLPISDMNLLWPGIYAELEQTARLLERDLRHLVDIEFTVEAGKFFMLQYRKGKHSPRAALRMAIDMADDPAFPLTRGEALERVERILQNPPMLPVGNAGAADAQVLTIGLGVSPGQAIGALCTSVDEAIAASSRGEAVILVRRETSPADIAGMAVAAGILTTLGGRVSHAAVVARGWGLPAVVGAEQVEVLDGAIRIGERYVPAGTEITIDGSSGEVLLGSHRRDEVEAPEVAVLRGWRRDAAAGPTPARTAGHAEDATVQTVSRVLALKGMGDAKTIAVVLGAPLVDVAAVIDTLLDGKDAIAMPNGRVRPAPGLVERVDNWFADAAGRVQRQMEAEMEAFHAVNAAFKALVSDWQMRTVEGRQVVNEHADRDYDAALIARLRAEIHQVIAPIIVRAAHAEPRLIRYLDRLETALEAIDGGDNDMVAYPLKDSYHTVWFELHEELIRLSGRKRTE